MVQARTPSKTARVISKTHQESLIDGRLICPELPLAGGAGQTVNPRRLSKYSRGKSANRPVMAMEEIMTPKWGLLGVGMVESRDSSAIIVSGRKTAKAILKVIISDSRPLESAFPVLPPIWRSRIGPRTSRRPVVRLVSGAYKSQRGYVGRGRWKWASAFLLWS